MIKSISKSDDTRLATILVVDDDLSLLEAASDLLRLAGYDILSAANGSEAVEVLGAELPDLIVSDIMMPVMDGYTLLQTVRGNPEWAGVPFIFLTARGQIGDIQLAMQEGVDHYLIKPFDPDELLDAVATRLARFRDIRASVEEDVDRMKDQILNIMGHELRTPLTYIYGNIELLRDAHTEFNKEELESIFQSIHKGSQRLGRLIEDLLLLVRIDSGAVALEIERHREYYKLETIVGDVLQRYTAKAEARNVTLSMNVPANLKVQCHPGYLTDSLERIVENGIKFSRPADGIVMINAKEEGGGVYIEVVDDGIGIPVEQQDHLFKRFEQINRGIMEQQGAGVGLPIASQLIELHGGTILLASDVEQGATFSIFFPDGRL